MQEEVEEMSTRSREESDRVSDKKKTSTSADSKEGEVLAKLCSWLPVLREVVVTGVSAVRDATVLLKDMPPWFSSVDEANLHQVLLYRSKGNALIMAASYAALSSPYLGTKYLMYHRRLAREKSDCIADKNTSTGAGDSEEVEGQVVAILRAIVPVMDEVNTIIFALRDATVVLTYMPPWFSSEGEINLLQVLLTRSNGAKRFTAMKYAAVFGSYLCYKYFNYRKRSQEESDHIADKNRTSTGAGDFEEVEGAVVAKLRSSVPVLKKAVPILNVVRDAVVVLDQMPPWFSSVGETNLLEVLIYRSKVNKRFVAGSCAAVLAACLCYKYYDYKKRQGR